jgi:hypothetical protein
MPAEVAAAAPATVPALVPDVVGAGLVLGDPEALAAQLESFSKARELFVDWLFNRLVAGIDYMLIHRKVGPRGNKTDCPERANNKSAACATCGGKGLVPTGGRDWTTYQCGIARPVVSFLIRTLTSVWLRAWICA